MKKKKIPDPKKIVELVEKAQEEWFKMIVEAIYKTKPITDVTPEEFKKGEYK